MVVKARILRALSIVFLPPPRLRQRHLTLQGAIGREKQLKGWSRAKKAALFAGDREALQTLSKRRKGQK